MITTNDAIKLALEHQKAGDLREAGRLYQEILKIHPANVNALHFLGIIFYQLKDYDSAIEYTKKAVQLEPSYFDAYNNLGIFLQTTGQFEEAIRYYQHAIQLNPNDAYVFYNLGDTFRSMEQFEQAINSYNKALQLNPAFAEALNNIGLTFLDMQDIDDAIPYFQKALQINPTLHNAYYNLGTAFNNKRQFDIAIDYYRKALAIKPDYADAHLNISFIFLLSGNFKDGWDGYEWRWQTEEFMSQFRDFPQPTWDGRISLTGKTIFVYAEQGVGDEIMFASCIPDLISQVGRCIVECDPRLRPIFSRSFPGAVFIDRIKSNYDYPIELQASDFKIAIGSLPKFFRPDLAGFPRQEAYLVADSHKAEVWRKRLNALGEGLKIGISWRGGKDPSIRRRRSTVLEQWSKVLSVQGVHFINLLYGDCKKELQEVREKLGVIIHDWEDADPLKDMDNFAAQITALDLVISVDNATVHMAGALGIPTWVLLPFACDWRWMTDCEDTPWYKNVWLFRQNKQGQWDSVFQHIVAELRRCISTKIMPEISSSYKSFTKIA